MNVWDVLLARPHAATSVVVPYDPAAADRLATARTALLAAAEGDVAAAEAEVARLDAAMVTICFALTGIGSARVEELRADHPRRKGAPLVNGQRATVDHAGFTAALLAEVIVSVTLSSDPDHPATDLSPEQVHELLDRLSVDDQVDLHVAALQLDQASTAISDT